MAIKANRWLHGDRHFVMPLAREQVGQWGCSLQRATFDPDVGEEVFARYLDAPKFARKFEGVVPFNLVTHTGMVRAPHGLAAFIVWNIAAHSPMSVLVEQYLNPQDIGTIRLLASAANQTHLKLIVSDNESGEMAAFVDYENVFGFEESVREIAAAIGHEPEGNFAVSTQWVMDHLTIQDLMGLPGSRRCW